MDMERHRKAETLRLMEWIASNPESWKQVCLALTEENLLIKKEYRDVLRNLRRNGFYQIIVALMYSNNECIKKAVEATIIMEIGEQWEDDWIDRFLDNLIDHC